MVKAIIFDCFGVLTTDHWKEFLATLPPEQVELARGLMYEHDSSRLNTKEFIEAVKMMTNRIPTGVERLREGEDAKNSELLAYIDKLKDSYKIGLLSNIGTNWIRESFLTQKEQKQFDAMTLSYEVGLAKPDPAIYVLMAERLGESLIDCVLIDDSASHCAAAARLGVTTIVYEDFRQMKRQLEPLLS